MSATWGEILRLYLQGAEGSVVAAEERYDHLNMAYRSLVAQLEIPELYQSDAEVNTVADQDWIALDCSVYSLISMVDLSKGRKLKREPDGLRGRAQYIEKTTGMPPSGQPEYYISAQNRILLRDTPPDIRTLQVQYRMIPAWVVEANLGEHPLTPGQYDSVIVHMMLEKFFTLHPPSLPDGTRDYQRAGNFQAAVQLALQTTDNRNVEEEFDQETYFTQRGYSMNVLGR